MNGGGIECVNNGSRIEAKKSEEVWEFETGVYAKFEATVFGNEYNRL